MDEIEQRKQAAIDRVLSFLPKEGQEKAMPMLDMLRGVAPVELLEGLAEDAEMAKAKLDAGDLEGAQEIVGKYGIPAQSLATYTG